MANQGFSQTAAGGRLLGKQLQRTRLTLQQEGIGNITEYCINKHQGEHKRVAKFQISRDILKVAEGPLRDDRRGPGAWKQQGEMRALDAPFCDWERDPTPPSPSMQGRDATGSAGSVLAQDKCWGCSWHPAALQVVSFHTILLLAIHSQLLTEGLLQAHLKAESPAALKSSSFVSWSVSGSGRAGFCRIAPTWEQHCGWDSAAAPSPSAAKPPVHPTMAVRSVVL